LAMKQMNFRKWAIIQHGGAISGVVLTVVLSIWIRDVWALAIGFLAENVARFVLSYVLCPFLPPIRWDKGAARELLNYSRGVFGLAILNLVFIRMDIFVLAKLYSPAELGVYSMAVYLIQTPTTFLIKLMTQTLMPTFSHIQDDIPRINRILSRVVSLVFLAGMPIVAFLFFCGHSLLTIVYGQRYSIASTAMILAGGVALLNVANNQITTVFFAKGLPQLHRGCVAVMAALMLILIYPLAHQFGLAGGQLAALVAMVFGFFVQIWLVRRVTHPDFSAYVKNFLVAGAISLSVVVVCLGARSLESWTRPLPNVTFGLVGCLVAYGLAGAIRLRDRGDGESVLGF
jgi:O-antigen/teichoic acid export membrane protein